MSLHSNNCTAELAFTYTLHSYRTSVVYHLPSAYESYFELGGALEIRDSIIFGFYPGLPYRSIMFVCLCEVDKVSWVYSVRSRVLVLTPQ